MASHQTAWTVFRFGPTFNVPFPDGQFPINSVDELYKQMIPDLNSTLPMPNPTWTNMAALGKRLRGAVLMGHSESGFFPEQAALIDPSGIKGIVSIEMPCQTNLTAAQLSTLAKIPTLIMFGDHLGDVKGGACELGEFFRYVPEIRGTAQRSRWRCADDASAEARYPWQQPHADAGQKQLTACGPDHPLD
jgi:hypothetical protein